MRSIGTQLTNSVEFRDIRQLAYNDFQKFVRGSEDVCPVEANCNNSESKDRINTVRKLTRVDWTPIDIPINEVLSVPARGGKNRIVTKSHPGLVMSADPIRESMFNLLRKDKRVRTVFKGDRLKALHELQLGDTDNEFISADLTAASDLIPHEYAIALWEGVLDQMSD